MTRITYMLTIALLVAMLALPAASSAMGADNVVTAVNTRDGSEVYRARLQIQRVHGDVVDNGNAAVAVSSCDGCETTSIAMQTLLVSGEPRVFTPENLALAMNVNCTGCETLASAYQNVVQTDGQVHFTAEGNQEIAGIRQDLQGLRHENLSIYETQQRVDELNTQLQSVTQDELVSAGPPQNAEATP